MPLPAALSTFHPAQTQKPIAVQEDNLVKFFLFQRAMRQFHIILGKQATSAVWLEECWSGRGKLIFSCTSDILDWLEIYGENSKKMMANPLSQGLEKSALVGEFSFSGG